MIKARLLSFFTITLLTSILQQLLLCMSLGINLVGAGSSRKKKLSEENNCYLSPKKSQIDRCTNTWTKMVLQLTIWVADAYLIKMKSAMHFDLQIQSFKLQMYNFNMKFNNL